MPGSVWPNVMSEKIKKNGVTRETKPGVTGLRHCEPNHWSITAPFFWKDRVMSRQHRITGRGMVAGGLTVILLLTDGTSALAARPKIVKQGVSRVNAARARSKTDKKLRAAGRIAAVGRLRHAKSRPQFVSAVVRRRKPIVIPANGRPGKTPVTRPRTVVVATHPVESTVLPVEVPDLGRGIVSGRVVKVTDGQTVIVDTGITLLQVCLLGVELMDDGGSQTDFKDAARVHLAELIEDQQVWLSFDTTAAKQNKDGLIVACLHRRRDSALINQRMVRDGYALAATVYDDQLSDVLLDDQHQARKAKAGLWGSLESTEPQGERLIFSRLPQFMVPQ